MAYGLIAGALEGAGAAGREGLYLAQKQFGDQELKAQEAAAKEKLDLTLADINNKAAQGRVETQETGAERRLGISEAGAEKRQGAQIAATREVHQIDRDFHLNLANQAETNALSRLNTQLASAEKLARMQIGANAALHKPAMDLVEEQLRSVKAVSTLRAAYAEAVRTGDTEAMKTLPKRIEALGYTGDKTDTAQLISIAGVAGKLATAIDATPEDKKIYGDIMRTTLAAAMGQKDVSTPTGSPAKPTTKAEVEALPDGTRFINPSDNKEYTKRGGPKPAAPATQVPATETPGTPVGGIIPRAQLTTMGELSPYVPKGPHRVYEPGSSSRGGKMVGGDPDYERFMAMSAPEQVAYLRQKKSEADRAP